MTQTNMPSDTDINSPAARAFFETCIAGYLRHSIASVPGDCRRMRIYLEGDRWFELTISERAIGQLPSMQFAMMALSGAKTNGIYLPTVDETDLFVAMMRGYSVDSFSTASLDSPLFDNAPHVRTEIRSRIALWGRRPDYVFVLSRHLALETLAVRRSQDSAWAAIPRWSSDIEAARRDLEPELTPRSGFITDSKFFDPFPNREALIIALRWIWDQQGVSGISGVPPGVRFYLQGAYDAYRSRQAMADRDSG